MSHVVLNKSTDQKKGELHELKAKIQQHTRDVAKLKDIKGKIRSESIILRGLQKDTGRKRVELSGLKLEVNSWKTRIKQYRDTFSATKNRMLVEKENLAKGKDMELNDKVLEIERATVVLDKIKADTEALKAMMAYDKSVSDERLREVSLEIRAKEDSGKVLDKELAKTQSLLDTKVVELRKLDESQLQPLEDLVNITAQIEACNVKLANDDNRRREIASEIHVLNTKKTKLEANIANLEEGYADKISVLDKKLSALDERMEAFNLFKRRLARLYKEQGLKLPDNI